MKMVFVESLDLLLAACEDACIYVWGIDEEGVRILRGMEYKEFKTEDEMILDGSRGGGSDDPVTQEYMRTYMKMRNARDRESFDLNDTTTPGANGGATSAGQLDTEEADAEIDTTMEQQQHQQQQQKTRTSAIMLDHQRNESILATSRLEKSVMTTSKTRRTTSLAHNQEVETATNRVAGFVLKKILCEHSSCVTSLVVIERPGNDYIHIYIYMIRRK